ncbi:aspartate aminotransferase family protein [Oceanithermus desulfurans]|uniref:Acetylornithine/acetyl-lysine aminotransferase n=2 Tax=Oceanithermus desulfurans TaxID=227924 RepID=A0A511RI97_9DEIN|nr:aspartate aminotransferase family protein [Oceanithermus desulfurans]MBB6030326.1 putrescine aminotransferase [Oceanithermus desulfurans]GEM89373.1 acetylornithine/acetyl-lysine aminotransferase [Oceanithermus desulfurans NBRC 100063]
MNAFELYERHVNPGLAGLLRFTGLDVVEDHAEGMYVWDTQGKRYLDFLGLYGTLNLGHRHPRVVEAVKQQLDRMPMSVRVMISEPTARLAARLAEITPGDLSMTFFGNSGTEAVEAAFKLARMHTGKPEIITTEKGFHGKTMGALSLTPKPEYQEPVAPLVPGVKVVPFGDAEAVAAAIGPETAAVIVEPVQGEGGINLPPEGYLRELRQITRERGVLLIFDEVQTGMGRTGKLWASEWEDVAPDLLTSAKALGGGVMPIGAAIGRPELFEPFLENPLVHSSTFGGNPLAAAAALAAIEVTLEEDLPARALAMGERLMQGLRELADRYPELIAEVRGRGLLVGLEFTDADIGAIAISELAARGVLTAFGLNNPKVVRLEPPLIVEEVHIQEALEALDHSLKATLEMLSGVL